MKSESNWEYIKKRRKELHSFYNSKEWQNVRQTILMRDKYICQVCGKPAEHVHHKIHLSMSNVYDPSVSLNPDNLVSLCKSCHDDQHKGEHARGRQTNEDYTYTFDANGMLVQKI